MFEDGARGRLIYLDPGLTSDRPWTVFSLVAESLSPPRGFRSAPRLLFTRRPELREQLARRQRRDVALWIPSIATAPQFASGHTRTNAYRISLSSRHPQHLAFVPGRGGMSLRAARSTQTTEMLLEQATRRPSCHSAAACKRTSRNQRVPHSVMPCSLRSPTRVSRQVVWGRKMDVHE